MSVTLSEVKRAAKAHRAPLAGESAGYLVLAIADQVLSAPRLVEASAIQLTEDGALRVLSGQASSDADAELSLRRALDQLLLVASSGSAALTRASRRTAPVGLAALVRELEAALIPVNRAAARRALARVQRETSRALASGVLPAEEPEIAAVAPSVVPAPPAAALPVAVAAPPVAALPVAAPPVAALPVIVPVAQSAPVELPVIAESHLDGVLTALCEELPAPAELQESDARTIALQVRPVAVAPEPEPEPELELEFDVEFEAEVVDSSAAPTVMRAVDVQPIVLGAADAVDDAPSELPAEARTRPEPAMIRKSLRAMLPAEFPPPPEAVVLPRTPTLGSLAAQLPVLDAAQLAQLLIESEPELERTPDLTVVTSAPVLHLIEEGTEPMPEVAPLSPGVAMVASRKSDVSELLSSFHVVEADSNASEGLRRAIKEMADLDLTPAPFAALIR